MFGMFGLGAQELLILLLCGGLPALIAVVVAVVIARRPARPRPPGDDF